MSTKTKQYPKKKKASSARYKYKTEKMNLAARERAENRARGPGVISDIAGELGTHIGGLVPIPGASLIGKFLGGKIGHLAEKITGFGDYSIAQNSIMKGGMTPPQIVNSVDTGSFIVRHREYIGDITATQDFTCRTYPINPGLSQTFPWLSTIANSFEQYRLRGVIFEFQSTSSDALLSAATSTALGSVAMSTDYDVADEPPTSKRQMLNSMFASSKKPSETFIHPIECKKALSSMNILYTRGAVVPSGFDARLYDFGRFNIATEGMQASNGVLGELWVTYEIELFKQQFNYISLADHFWCNAISQNRPLGTVVGSNLARGGTMGGAIGGDGRSYSFPSQVSGGKYLVTYTLTGTSSVNSKPPTVVPVNCVFANFFAEGSSIGSDAPNPAATTGNTAFSFTLIVNKQNAGFTFAQDGGPPAAAKVDLWVVRLPDSLERLG